MNVDEKPAIQIVRLETDTPNVQAMPIEPHHGRGDFFGEVGSRQQNSHILAEPIVIRLVQAQEAEDRRSRFASNTHPTGCQPTRPSLAAGYSPRSVGSSTSLSQSPVRLITMKV